MMERFSDCQARLLGCGRSTNPAAILIAACRAQECWMPPTNSARRWWRFPAAKTVIHKEIGRDRRGRRGAQEVRLASAHTHCCWKEDSICRASPLSVLLDPSGRPEGHPRKGGVAEGRVRSRGVRDQGGEGRGGGLTGNVNDTIFDGTWREDIAKVSTSPPNSVSGGVFAIFCPLRAMPMSARHDHGPLPHRTKNQEVSRRVRVGKGKKWNFHDYGLFLDFLPATRNTNARRGHAARTSGWQKPCICSAKATPRPFKRNCWTHRMEPYGTGKYEKCADCMVALRLRAEAPQRSARAIVPG